VSEGAQGPPLVNPLNTVFFFIYDANYFINFLKTFASSSPEMFFYFRCKLLHKFFKNILLRKRLKDLTLIYII
jgi:hypothetical protein